MDVSMDVTQLSIHISFHVKKLISLALHYVAVSFLY